MLVGKLQPIGDQRHVGPDRDHDFVSVVDITAFLRQYMRSIVACILVGLLAAWFYAGTTDSIFVARTQILIEPKLPQFLADTGGVNTSLDTAQIESQIAVMRSEKIATMVIGQLGLMDNPDFMRPRSPKLAERFQVATAAVLRTAGFDGGAWPSPPVAPDAPAGQDDAVAVAAPGSEAEDADAALREFERTRYAISVFQRDLDVRRVGVSYAVDINFQSRDPELAADIANAAADTFVREQIETKAASARQGGEWMERRLGELRSQMNTATQIAQEFRARHDYRVQPPGARLVNGQLVYDEGSEGAPTLEELEVTADTYRKMYESFLQSLTSNLSQQSYPIADARVITAATRPLAPSRPRRKLMLAFGIVAGTIAGVGLAFLRQALDPTIRSPRQIREEFGLDCIGELPAVGRRNGGFGRLDEVAVAPRAAFSENLRKAKAAIGLAATAGQPVRFIGLVSALPGEGKSTCASNLALLYSTGGKRTLLIDADLEHSVLSNRLTKPAGKLPAPERRTGPDDLAAGVVPAGNRCFDLLPGATTDAKGLLSPKTLETLLPDLDRYDVVIFDLPPLTSGSDRLAIGRLLDGVVVVAEWGRTPVDLVRELVWSLQANKTPIVGVLMTKVRRMSAKPYRRNRLRPAR